VIEKYVFVLVVHSIVSLVV